MFVGWVKLHREILEKAIWKCSTSEQKAILMTIIMLANHTENQWIWKGKQFKCQPGQFITSLKSIAFHAGVSVKNVRTALTKFEKLDFLASEAASDGRMITVCNWDRYQGNEHDNGKPLGKGGAKDRQRGGKGMATNNNDNNPNNDNKDKNKELFELSRKLYPGTRLGNESEFKNFQKHKDWKECLPLLKPAIEKQINHKQLSKKQGNFTPEWKHFKTWINQRCWEEELPDMVDDEMQNIDKQINQII